MVCPETELVDIVGQFRLSCMCGRCEEIPLQIRLPQRTQRVDDKDIRIQIQDAVQMSGQEKRRQQVRG